MPAYFPTNVTSDVASVNLMNAFTLPNTTIPLSFTATSQSTLRFITPIPYPNNNSVTTTTSTLVLSHTVVNTSIQISASLYRVNSAGVVQAQGTPSAEIACAATMTFSGLDEPTWSTTCGDRLLLRLNFRNTAMANRNITLGTNRVGTYLLSSIPHNGGTCPVLRKPSWVVSGIGKFITPTMVTGANAAYFSFGATVSGTTGLVTYNRTISFSTDTEATRTVMSTAARIVQGASGFSITGVYHINGYTTTGVSTKNKVTLASDTQSSPTINLTVERRGPGFPCPQYLLSKIYFLGGYSDALAQYRTDVTYISTSTDTATNTTAITVAKHVPPAIYEKDTVYMLGGYTTGDATTNTIIKYVMGTDTASNTSLTESINMIQGYACSSTTAGYRTYGATVTNTSNVKITYSTETISAAPDSPTNQNVYQGVSSASSTTGYVWTGYRSVNTIRTYQKLNFLTETWVNADYNRPADANNGWINGSGGV